MATRGPKPKAAFLKLVTGNPGKRAVAEDLAATSVGHDNGLEPPKKLKARQQRLWDTYVRAAPWLTPFDVPRAFMWVELHAEFESGPNRMVAGRIAQLRAVGSELGLDPASRAKMSSGKNDGKQKDPAEAYFD